MTFKELAKQLTAAVQTVPNLVNVLRDGFEQMEGGSSSGHDYSTDEQKIGKWIDGKDLYERTFVIPNSSTINKDYVYPHNLTFDNIMIMNAFCMDHSTKAMFPFTITATDDKTLSIRIDGTNILFSGSNQLSVNANRDIYVIVRYTKST